MVFKCVFTWESRAGKGKVIVCLISTPSAGLPALARRASAVVHTRRGGRGGRRRGGGADWEESGHPAAHAPSPSNKWAPQRKCKRGVEGRTGAEHGGDVSAPPGRHPARPSRGQREPQRERERRDAPPERRVTITTSHSGRVRAGRDATRAQAPRERPAANVSAASRWGRGARQAWGRREPACVRSSPLSSPFVRPGSSGRGDSLRPCKPCRRQRRADPAEGRSSSHGSPSLPRPSREAATSARLDPGTGWH